MSPSSQLSHESHATERLWHLLLVAAIAAGVWARFAQLGLWPLTTDEYFLGRSVGFIVEQGVPRFPCGGYYTRGLLQQYLTAPFLAWSSDPEWALRMVPVLANLLGLPAVYLIGRRLGGTAVASSAAILYSLSIWEIELARFARMYAPFQALFLWQIVFLLRAMDNGQGARAAGRMMLLLAAVGLIVYEGGIFLILVAALPVLTGRRPISMPHFFALAALTIGAVALQFIDFRGMGTMPVLPEIGPLLPQSGAAASLGPLLLPHLYLNALPQAPFWLALYAPPLLLTVAALRQAWRSPAFSPAERGLWGVVLLLAAMHLFLLAALLLLLWRLWGPAGHGKRLHRLIPAALLANLLFWTLFALWGPSAGGWRTAIAILAGYPEIFGRVVYPLAVAMPITVVVLLLSLTSLLALATRPAAEFMAAGKTLLGCTLVVLLLLGLLETSYVAGRYSFFIYPVLLILAVDVCRRLSESLRPPRYRTALLAILLGVFMIAAEDFSYDHLRAIATPEINFRTRYDEGRKALYMHRRDFSSPALYVNEHRQPGEKVISAVRVSDYYLRETDFLYIDYRRRSFANYLACGGSRELWSHAPLLYRLESLHDAIQSSAQPVWIIVYADEWGGEEGQMVRTEYAEQLVYRNIDQTINVYRIPAPVNTAKNMLTN